MSFPREEFYKKTLLGPQRKIHMHVCSHYTHTTLSVKHCSKSNILRANAVNILACLFPNVYMFYIQLHSDFSCLTQGQILPCLTEYPGCFSKEVNIKLQKGSPSSKVEMKKRKGRCLVLVGLKRKHFRNLRSQQETSSLVDDKCATEMSHKFSGLFDKYGTEIESISNVSRSSFNNPEVQNVLKIVMYLCGTLNALRERIPKRLGCTNKC